MGFQGNTGILGCTMNLKTARETFPAIYAGIKSQSPPHHFEFKDPFWVLITTIMSHRTKDEVTDVAARNLYNRYADATGLSQAKYEDVYGLISRVGFATVKARRVIDAAAIIRDRYGGKVPDTVEELTVIPGVGRKTANVVLADALGKPAIAVDTHVHRISNRIGWSNSKNPDETEQDLRKIVPVEYWLGFNPILVEFGKKICRPIGPKCSECLVSSYCRYFRESQEKQNVKPADKTIKRAKK